MPFTHHGADAVRFRTEKSLFSGRFAAKFLPGGTSNQAAPADNKKGMSGHVR
jgi:hypothetical protein